MQHLALRRFRYPLIAFAFIALVFVCIYVCIPRPLFSQPTSTVVLDCNGNILAARIATDEQWRFAEVDTLSQKYIDCLIAYEDRRFRWHLGIDVVAICRALVTDIRAGKIEEGGSTITMQLARIARGNRPRTIGQKIIEALWAIGIECTYSKEDILQLYASHAPFGGNVVGIDAAAWRYFGHSHSELSWAESATLAVLPNSPALVHISKSRELLKKKRDALLKNIYENGTISYDDYLLAIDEPLPERPFQIENSNQQIIDRLAKNHKGQTITTTIDGALQQRVQAIANAYQHRYSVNYINDIGILVANVHTGEVLAYVGNASARSATNFVDMISAERSTGSTLKPFLYASMLTNGEITPSMIIADTPLDIHGFAPQNYNHTFNGAVGADKAIRQSLNVPLVRMLNMHDIGRFMNDLRSLGMTTLHFSSDHYGAALILGGAEGSLWDLVGMYASMARRLINYIDNGNKYATTDIHPLTLTGNLPPSAENPTNLPDAASIWYTLEAMSGLNRPEEEAEWQQFSSSKRIAWKTGTSYGSRDAWAIGVTRDYAVGVWVGNATGEGRFGLTGVGNAGPVMFDVFSGLPQSEWFTTPLDDMDPMLICRQSGCIASDACAQVDTVLLPRNCVQTPVCKYCRLVHLSPDGRWQVNSSCMDMHDIHTTSWFVLSPSMEYFYRLTHADYKPLPPLRSDCATNQRNNIEIIYPEQGKSIVLPRDFDGQIQSIVCRAADQQSHATIFWHLDEEYLGETHGVHEICIAPQLGKHTLTIVDNYGNTTNAQFVVR
ncbi:MAG: penicillin-binding protein 1C [Bacteroidales bacterium]|nr:penicillin-binding protein 1C [Bacteroidales bacterium]